MDTDHDVPGRLDANEALSEILSRVLHFEPGTQCALSLLSEKWDKAADSVLDTLAAEGFDVPFTDCEQFSGRVELMGAKEIRPICLSESNCRPDARAGRLLMEPS